MKIIDDMRNLNKFFHSKQIRKTILGNTFLNRRSIQVFKIEKLEEMVKRGNIFEVTEGEGSKCLIS